MKTLASTRIVLELSTAIVLKRTPSNDAFSRGLGADFDYRVTLGPGMSIYSVDKRRKSAIRFTHWWRLQQFNYKR